MHMLFVVSVRISFFFVEVPCCWWLASDGTAFCFCFFFFFFCCIIKHSINVFSSDASSYTFATITTIWFPLLPPTIPNQPARQLVQHHLYNQAFNVHTTTAVRQNERNEMKWKKKSPSVALMATHLLFHDDGLDFISLSVCLSACLSLAITGNVENCFSFSYSQGIFNFFKQKKKKNFFFFNSKIFQ